MIKSLVEDLALFGHFSDFLHSLGFTALLLLQCIRKVAVHLHKLLVVISTGVDTLKP
jgi:hypothetical protein